VALDEEIGARLFKIRAAWGRGEREPETLEAFADRVKRLTGVDYNPVTLSTLERGKRRWLVSDVATFALVDPHKRGRAWLAGFDLPEEQPAIVGTIQPELPGGAPLEPIIPAPRKGAAASKEADVANARGKKK
jgi:hypothetical protein